MCPHSPPDLETFRQLCTIQRTFFPSGELFPIVYEQLNSKCLTNHRFVRWKIFSSLHATNPNKIYKINCCRKQEEYKIKEICHTFSIAKHHWKIVYDRNPYFGLGLIPKPKPKLSNAFCRYRNQYWNHISKGESGYQVNLALVWGNFFIIKRPLNKIYCQI